MGFIDAHVHVWTADTDRYPLAPGFTAADLVIPSFTPEELFAHTRLAGVTRVHLIQPRFYGFDNSYMLDVIRQHPGVFMGTAVIDAHATDVADRMAALAARGVRALRIHPRLSGQPPATWLRPAGFATMFAAGARLNLAMSCLIDPDGLPEVDRMCNAFPDTPVLLDHLARIGADGEIRDREVEALCALARHPRVAVKVGGFYALGAKEPPYADLVPLIRRVVEDFGPRRCLWESDCPYQVLAPHTYAAGIGLVRRLDFLTEADREWLLGRSAESLLHLNEV